MQFIFKLLYTTLFFLVVNTVIGQTITSSSNPICRGNSNTFSVDGEYNLAVDKLHWDLGNGSIADSTTIASVVYATVGKKTVTFSVNGTIVATKEVYVYIVEPTFTLSAIEGCEPLDVTFNTTFTTFQATGGLPSVNVVTAELTAGDGALEDIIPTGYTHTYIAGNNTNGIYNASLTIEDELGCKGTKTEIITVFPKPEAIIVTDPAIASSCTKPYTVIFNDGSDPRNGTGIATWNWNFGQSTTSNLPGPTSITYNNNGSYNVSLTVSNSDGCTDTDNIAVSVGAPTAGFTLNTANQDTICGLVKFTSTSSTSNVYWDFNDFGIGSVYFRQSDVTLDFTNYPPGKYTIKIKAFVNNNGVTCEDTYEHTIVIPDVKADFEISPNYGCEMPFDVTFIDKSINASEYTWNYGDGNPTGTEIGSHLYTYDRDDTLTYSIRGNNVWYPTLKVKSKFGCESFFRLIDGVAPDSVTVFEPNARFMADTVDGCAPLNVTFLDSVNYDRGRNDVLTYTWNFGDGSPEFAGGPLDTIAKHTYTTPGVYYARMRITTAMGCNDTSFWMPIRVGDAGLVGTDLDINPPSGSTICPDDFITFSYPDEDNPDVDMWHVKTFGVQNQVWSCSSNGQSPVTTQLNQFVGDIGFSITAANNGCFAGGVENIDYNIKGPIARFMGYNIKSCVDNKTIEFTPYMGDVLTLNIDYGDGTQEQFFDPVQGTTYSHEYLNPGNYTISMRGENAISGCDDYEDEMNIQIRDMHANFTFPKISCLSNELEFIATDESSVGDVLYQGYAWKFEEDDFWKESGDNKIKHIYTSKGLKRVTLRRTDIHGCTVDSTKELQVSQYDALIGQINNYSCYPKPGIAFTAFDSTNHDLPIVSWDWKIGPSSFNTESANYTQALPPFGNNPKVNMRLITVDSAGCIDTAYAEHKVYKVDGRTDIIDPQACLGETIDLKGKFDTYENYEWIFESEDTLFGFENEITFDTIGTFPVRMVATDIHGCTDTSAVVNLEVQDYPKPHIVIEALDHDNQKELCVETNVTFIDSTTYSPFSMLGTRTWDLDKPDGQTNDGASVVYLYGTPGPRTISLTIETTFGCKKTVTRNILIEGPFGNLDLTTDKICKGEVIGFTIEDTESVGTYTIDYGDGVVEENVVFDINTRYKEHKYSFHPPNGGTLPVHIELYTSNPNSLCFYPLDTIIFIHEVIAGFDRNTIGEPNLSDYSRCFEENISHSFFNTSEGIDKWSFDYGDGKEDAGIDGEHPNNHIYNKPGIYDVTIAVIDDELGCRDTLTKTMNLLPEPLIITDDVLGCDDGDPIQLLADGGAGATYIWSPTTGLNDPTIPNPEATIFETRTYTVQVIDLTGCIGTKDVEAKVLQTPFLNEGLDCDFYGDSALFIGESVVIDLNHTGSSYVFNWTPSDYLSCDNCYNPTATPLENIEYTVHIIDTSYLACFDFEQKICFTVRKEASVDVPSAFSPNGDGVNDVVFVDGWGIKELVYFKIFNRWGDLVFETDDKKMGWDGTYHGVVQEQDVYIYQVAATFYAIDEEISKQGNITLFR